VSWKSLPTLATTLYRVSATDHGRNPVAGSLVKWTSKEIVVRRQDPEVGSIMAHFPNTGFAVSG